MTKDHLAERGIAECSARQVCRKCVPQAMRRLRSVARAQRFVGTFHVGCKRAFRQLIEKKIIFGIRSEKAVAKLFVAFVVPSDNACLSNTGIVRPLIGSIFRRPKRDVSKRS
jgi:hypothetical protein